MISILNFQEKTRNERLKNLIRMHALNTAKQPLGLVDELHAFFSLRNMTAHRNTYDPSSGEKSESELEQTKDRHLVKSQTSEPRAEGLKDQLKLFLQYKVDWNESDDDKEPFYFNDKLKWKLKKMAERQKQ